MSLTSLVAYNSSSDEEVEEITKPTPLKKEKKKIFAPARVSDSDDSDNDDNLAKNKNIATLKPSQAAKAQSSGLFATLPAPNSSFGGTKMTGRPMVPYVLTKRSAPPTKPTPPKKAKVVKPVNNDDSEEEANDSNNVSFFSFLDSKEPVSEPTLSGPTLSGPTLSGPSLSEPTYSRLSLDQQQYDYAPVPPSSSYFQVDQPNLATSKQYDGAGSSYPEASTIATTSNDWIDQKQLARLQGQGGKRKKEKIEFIDVHADDALEGNKELMLKDMSKEKQIQRQSHSTKGANMPTSRQKSKHQLSYLIHQAKANELKLQEQWASGKAKRDAARLRYGF